MTDTSGDTGDDDETPERISYNFEPPERLWREWGDTVPRSITLQARLESLIAADAVGQAPTLGDDHDTRDSAETVPADDARRAVIQVRKRAMRALQEVGRDDRACREEIREIKTIVDDVI